MGNCIAHVINKHIEEKGSQDRSLRNTGDNFKRLGKNIRNTDLRFPVIILIIIIIIIIIGIQTIQMLEN
jgi:hypothetical protein